jgi:hypothetical protein
MREVGVHRDSWALGVVVIACLRVEDRVRKVLLRGLSTLYAILDESSGNKGQHEANLAK